MGPAVSDFNKRLICYFPMLFSVTPIQSNPKGTDTFVTLLSGSQHWILIPTTEKKDLEKISCGSAKENKECQEGSWIGHIFPQVSILPSILM